MAEHFWKRFLAGLVAILPVGGLILILYKLDDSLSSLFDHARLPTFPGRGLLAGVLVIYLLGLTVSTVVGQWIWARIDRVLGRVPGLAVLYQTIKQILGYGTGKDAMFRSVVLVKDPAAGTLELGLVTEEVQLPGEPMRWCVFLPGSPNPAVGRMVLVEPERCVATQIPVDGAFKALLSTGKTGL